MRWTACLLACLLAACASGPAVDAGRAVEYDLIVRNGTVYDGSGGEGRRADIGIRGDRIVTVDDLSAVRAADEIDAAGLAVAPGFVNSLSWATDALIADGRALSDLKQGVTLEVFGEGWTLGPLTPELKVDYEAQQGDIRYPITWDTLGGYLEALERRGIVPNVASFVGASTVRQNVLGNDERAPGAEELARMQALVRLAMEEGALGVGASLIYAPGAYATPAELTALVEAAAAYGGGYIAHVRSEAERLLEALDELIGIARAADTWAEVYHLKAAGRDNWPKMARAIERIAGARAEGLEISANMYAYTAGATGLNACIPPAVQAGGLEAWMARMAQPEVRADLAAKMRAPGAGWENLCHAAGGADKILFIGFKNERLKPLTGKTLAEVASQRGQSPEETAIDLMLEDHSRVDTAFFLMSEQNVELGLRQPWVSLGSDAEASAPEGVFLKSSTHPRAYGNVARFLGHYVRERGVATLGEAVRRLSAQPAETYRIRERGRLAPGYYADVVVFDPARIADTATYERPQQFARGVRDVIVNGRPALRDGEPTGATPGRVVRGPGWSGWGRETSR